jgi:hypothetical protein
MADVVALSARSKEAQRPPLDFYIGLALTLAAFTVYVLTLTPGVLDGDSGEWQYMANILGIPHSTGYPLYILLAKLVTLVPIGNPAWRVNLFSAICAALTVPVVYLLAKRVSGSRAAAVLAACFFGFMPTLWASATIAEVYALNTLLIALSLYFAVRFLDFGQPRDVYLMALFFGLALANHRIAFYIAPALLLVVWLRRSVFDMRKLAFAALACVVPLALYLYIPIRASQLLAVQSPENWELYPREQAIISGQVTAYYNHTPQGFINLVTALDNRNKLGFENANGEDQTAARLENTWTLLREQMDPFAIALALFGIVILFRRERNLAIVLVAAAAGIGVVSTVLRAESTRFYFSGAYLVLVLFLAVAMGWVLNLLKGRASERVDVLARGLYFAAILFFAFFPLTALYFNYPAMDRTKNNQYELYARSLLNDNLAPNAVLIAPWEIATPVRYFQFVENIRPDVLTIHESPIRPQYQKLMDAAHRLGRPFYYAQFSPEDKNSDEPRTVQATAFPLTDAPAPQHTLDVELNESIRAIGYDWIPDLQQGNRTARLAVYYQVIKPTRIEYVTEVELGDEAQETHGYWSRHPVSEYHPTYQWQPGEYYRDVYDVVLDHDAPYGTYTADVTWFEYYSDTGKRREESAKTIHIRDLHVGQPSTLKQGR